MKNVFAFGALGIVALLAACAANQDGTDSSSAAVNETTPVPTTTSRGGVPPVSTGRTSGDGGTVVASGDGGTPSCYAAQGSCDPTNPNACPSADQACDINGSTHMFQCFDPPNDAHLGDACDNSQGPFCANGLACNQGTCATYCCDDSVCAAGTTCQATGTVGAITIKVCK